MRTLIRNIVLTPGAEGGSHLRFIKDAALQIENNQIIFAGKENEAPAFLPDQVIDGKGALAMPGLCNMHTHTPMTLMRSIGNDLELSRWLTEAIYPVEKNLTDDSVRVASELGILEMIRFGTTSFNDMYMHMDMLAEATLQSGMRALLGYGVVDFDGSGSDLIPGIEFIEKWQSCGCDRIKVSVDPHSEVSTTPAVLEKVGEVAEKYGVPIHVHVSETLSDVEGCIKRRGVRPPQYLEKLGLTKFPLIAAHCVWMDDRDIEVFNRENVLMVHNPISNLKLASGIAPIQKMLDAGCHIGLGTDGVASNNNLNLWEEMKLMALLQKGTLLDATAVKPAQILAAATIEGANAMGYTNLGLLKEGYLADLILVDLNTTHVCPWNDLETELIYSVQGTDVRMTMVDGKVLYLDGEFKTLDPKEVFAHAKEQRDILLKRK